LKLMRAGDTAGAGFGWTAGPDFPFSQSKTSK